MTLGSLPKTHITDSDDGLDGVRSYDVEFVSDQWYLRDYADSDDWYIRRVDASGANLIPERCALIVWSALGCMGFVFVRRRRK